MLGSYDTAQFLAENRCSIKSCRKKVVVTTEYNYYRLKVNLMFLSHLVSYLVMNAFLLYFASGYLFWNPSFKIIFDFGNAPYHSSLFLGGTC